jgi:hypothetical protein
MIFMSGAILAGAGEDAKGAVAGYTAAMVRITYPDRDTERRAIGFLMGRFSARILAGGEHLIPEAALESMAEQNIPFTVLGKATYEQQVAAIRGAATAPAKRRAGRPPRVAG